MHFKTPRLAVNDPRGLPVCAVDFYRGEEGAAAQARISRSVFDKLGRAIEQWDPRLVKDASAPANLANIYSLSGKALSTTSVDAGWRVSLLGEADQPVQGWDGRGSQRWTEYDDQLRPLALFEQAVDGEPLCTERYGYGGADPAFAAHNQCGQLIRHDDPAGTQLFAAFGVNGGLLEQTRHFLRALDSADWPEPVADRDSLLEPGAGATNRSRFNALGEAIEQTDAQGHRQLFSQTVAGQLHEVRLQLAKDTAPTTLVSAIQYNAHGQTERETAGNGVITTLEYGLADGRLSRLQAKRSNDVLQDLRYEYDAVGNVLSIEDAALPIRYFANQRIEPINHYRYDSLYQLIEATGWEVGAANQGPSLSTTANPAAVGHYRQTYRYDAGNNLLELTHEGPQSHGHRLVAAAHSNHCLPVLDNVEPTEEDFRQGFDANGNLLNLQPGQALSWDLRNQLREVRSVERDSGPDDSERYIYGADGLRVRKVRSTQTKTQTVTTEVRYLPGLELRTHSGTGEAFHVINVQTGRGSVRVLHWEAKRPAEIANDQQRYSLTDHLGSATLELDQDAKIISQERYYPFGGTAWADGEAVQVSYKTVRYSGKERDATGFYYYGFRYYVAGWQRWLNPDPAGQVDGLNLYRMVGNNPLGYTDTSGLELEPTNKKTDRFVSKSANEMVVDVDIFKRFFFRARLSQTRVKVLDEGSGIYEVSDDFEVVEVGVGSREELLRRNRKGVVASNEVKDTLKGYRQKYTNLMSESSHKWYEWGGDAAKQRRNYTAGEYVSRQFETWFIRGEQTRQMEVDLGGAPNNRLFALIKKSDRVKEPADRKLYGLTLISLSREEGSNDTDLAVDFTIIDPDSQLGSTQLHHAVSEVGTSENTLRLRGAGTYLTMNALSQVDRTVNMKTIRANAINPRSAAIAMGWGESSPY
ncbi:RHS repeat-associated core domain-containing protein [Pseudomonas sp. H3(2019)]|uniref:RHS repeat-associated core domain-containing protein n=1 Tax=Pseudomonas sp. H3(2019) TaxID=2598724 RepID=UPI00119469BA|nr:RHS repeat-associated core domain-containing protein [Pseudomonas sp. H3(2019)]TVT81320.1 RHS repeat protein [Pseudomonas sp. H3(2019)]